jgi:hypothetical protein
MDGEDNIKIALEIMTFGGGDDGGNWIELT